MSYHPTFVASFSILRDRGEADAELNAPQFHIEHSLPLIPVCGAVFTTLIGLSLHTKKHCETDALDVSGDFGGGLELMLYLQITSSRPPELSNARATELYIKDNLQV